MQDYITNSMQLIHCQLPKLPVTNNIEPFGRISTNSSFGQLTTESSSRKRNSSCISVQCALTWELFEPLEKQFVRLFQDKYRLRRVSEHVSSQADESVFSVSRAPFSILYFTNQLILFCLCFLWVGKYSGSGNHCLEVKKR